MSNQEKFYFSPYDQDTRLALADNCGRVRLQKKLLHYKGDTPAARFRSLAKQICYRDDHTLATPAEVEKLLKIPSTARCISLTLDQCSIQGAEFL